MDLSSRVQNILLEADIVRRCNLEGICHIIHTPGTQRANFLDYMAKRGRRAWETYLDVLRDHGEPSHGPLRQLWNAYDLTQGPSGRSYLERYASNPSKFRDEVPARLHHHIKVQRPNALNLSKANNAAQHNGWKSKLCRQRPDTWELDQLVRDETERKRTKKEHDEQNINNHIHLIRTRPCRANQECTIWTDHMTSDDSPMHSMLGMP